MDSVALISLVLALVVTVAFDFYWCCKVNKKRIACENIKLVLMEKAYRILCNEYPDEVATDE